MGARGPLPAPDNVRQIRGNPGKRSSKPRPVPVRAAPSPPGWLGREGKAEWKRICPELERLGLLARLDRAVLSMYCDAWERWTIARSRLAKEGLLARGQKGEVRKHPAWQVYRDSAGMVANLAKELGVSPNARLRMTLPDPDPGDEADLD